MPKERILGPYTPQKSDDDTRIKKNIIQVQDYYKGKIELVNRIEDRLIKATTCVILIDSLSQEYNNYSKNNRKNFTSFVNQFQTYCNYINEVEPITLFYKYESNIKGIRNQYLNILNPQKYPARPIISIDDFRISDEQLVKECINSTTANNLINLIKSQEKDPNRYLDNHRLVSLIYNLRCKLVHEASNLGSESKSEREDSQIIEPYYRNISRVFVKSNQIVSCDVFELVIPTEFILELTKNICNNYFQFCYDNSRHPYKNGIDYKRKLSLTWDET